MSLWVSFTHSLSVCRSYLWRNSERNVLCMHVAFVYKAVSNRERGGYSTPFFVLIDVSVCLCVCLCVFMFVCLSVPLIRSCVCRCGNQYTDDHISLPRFFYTQSNMRAPSLNWCICMSVCLSPYNWMSVCLSVFVISYCPSLALAFLKCRTHNRAGMCRNNEFVKKTKKATIKRIVEVTNKIKSGNITAFYMFIFQEIQKFGPFY